MTTMRDLISRRALQIFWQVDTPILQTIRQFSSLVINLKTAKPVGIIVPDTLIGRAEEVIESNPQNVRLVKRKASARSEGSRL